MSVCRPVNEIVSVKEWHDLETGAGSFKVIENGEFLHTAQRDHSTNKHFIEIGQRLAIVKLKLTDKRRETWDHNKENLQ